MSQADIRIFDCVSDSLAKNLPESEAQAILVEIREKYYSKHLPEIHFQKLQSGIESCRTCPEATSPPVVGWWNWQDCDLLIVSANPYSANSGPLGQALAQSGFASAFCGAIHVTKCNFSSIEQSNIDNCRGYLYDQVDVAKPKAIAVTGAVAFDCFSDGTRKYKESIGTSWWAGLHKVYCLPLLKDIEDPAWTNILKDAYKFIYGSLEDVFVKE